MPSSPKKSIRCSSTMSPTKTTRKRDHAYVGKSSSGRRSRRTKSNGFIADLAFALV